MMTREQQNWMTSGISVSTATWQLLGNQTVMTRMGFRGCSPVAISAFLTAKATHATAGAVALTPTQATDLLRRGGPHCHSGVNSDRCCGAWAGRLRF